MANNFEIILEALAEKLAEQKQTIGYQKMRIEILEQKLNEAEKHL